MPIQSKKKELVPSQPNKKFVIGLGFVILIILVAILANLHSQPQSKKSPTAVKISTTPESFDDFIGTATAVTDDTITMSFTGTASDGSALQKTFSVNVDTKTEVKTLTMVNNEPVLKPLKLQDIHSGNTVFIAAGENIASQTEFTATKIYLYPPNS